MSTAWDVKDAYLEIDPILEHWAKQNGLRWTKEYKDYSVCSYSFSFAGTESVQFWVDPSENGSVAVHVALNSSLDARRKSQQATYGFDTLNAGLNDALRVAREWKIADAPNQ